ncbi:MAG: D-glycero-alpha-D-manno-heptose-1,7-bisphosphate 7-phosphatase [Kiloniellales bacterium]
MKPAVFLDRDGVLVRSLLRDGKPSAPRSLAEFEILPEAPDALGALKEAGFLLIVVTNQPDVGNGLIERTTVEAMHDRLGRALPLDGVKVCYHRPSEGCDCRKPRPGMLRQAARELAIDMASSYMVGDRWSDMVVGHSQGCCTVFIDRRQDQPLPVLADVTVGSLAEAAQAILARNRPSAAQG